MQLFYAPQIDISNDHFTFEREESRHIIKVLRKKEGEIIYITDGSGHLLTVRITVPNEKKCEVHILSCDVRPSPTSSLHMAVAPTKMNDRYEWFLEKATEIGVTEITPIICERSERKVINWERYQKVVLSAMKQSLRTHLPILHKAMVYDDFISQLKSGTRLIAHCEEDRRKPLATQIEVANDVTLLIGPEGDFSAREIQTALSHNFVPVSLGTYRLRTETAAIAACTIVNQFLEV